MFCNIGFAEITLIKEEYITDPNKWTQKMAIDCVDGYKFVTTKTVEGVSLVQFFKVKLYSITHQIYSDEKNIFR